MTFRRAVLGFATAAVADCTVSLMAPRAAPISIEASPDAVLITACEEYLRIQRAFEVVYAAFPGEMPEDGPAWSILDPVPDLEERIVALHATTAEGHFARARCVAFHYLAHHTACQDDPDGAREDRFKAAWLRDLVRLERGSAA